MEFGFRILIASGIPDSLKSIRDSKAHDSRFLQQKFPGFPNNYVWGINFLASYQMRNTTRISFLLKQQTQRHILYLYYYTLYSVSVFSLAERLQLILKIRATKRLVRYLLPD